MKTDPDLLQLATRFRQKSTQLAGCNVVTGFDGFVDEMISVVAERHGLDRWTPVKDIGTFGDWIKAAAGRSSLREIIVHRTDPGGCAVNLGDGLIALGIGLECFATLGQPRHAAFDDFAALCRGCYSWGRLPGRTLAFEFEDGKLMFSAVKQLAEFDCDLLDKTLADGVYAAASTRARLIALTDWSLYPHMTSCWRKLQKEVYSKLAHHPFFLIDLVDPSGRSAIDIRAMGETLSGFESAGPTVLGLNGNEANALARSLGLPTATEEPRAVEDQATVLREKLQISQVVIHCVKLAALADANGTRGVWGPFCPSPKKSTGAGDRFNAGYCAGLLLGLEPAECLQLGCASSGFFVRHARSASCHELGAFVEAWAHAKTD
ncbi:MAG: PfkB family carbohydrate kinase [Candidatus Omnitrophica bacterium]|nr:PfkB family carbohydrate kinase [Candidatus Omnitrophota bacterium]